MGGTEGPAGLNPSWPRSGLKIIYLFLATVWFFPSLLGMETVNCNLLARTTLHLQFMLWSKNAERNNKV